MPRHPPSIPAIALWLAWQLTALGLSAFRIPLSAHYPAAAEQSALSLMLIAQIAGAALLYPILLRDTRSTLIAIALAWPICELAAFLADADLTVFAIGESYVSAWLIVLFIWNRRAVGAIAPIHLSSLVALLTFGGPLLFYMQAEFNSNSSSAILLPRDLLGPILGVYSLIQTGSSHFEIWLSLIFLALVLPFLFKLAKLLRPSPAV